MFSTVKGAKNPDNFVLQEKKGDVEIYKTGENTFCAKKQIGDYSITLIGGDLKLLVDMINSVQINNVTLNI